MFLSKKRAFYLLPVLVIIGLTCYNLNHRALSFTRSVSPSVITPQSFSRKHLSINRSCEEAATLRELRDPVAVIEVVTCGPFLERVKQFNLALDGLRSKLLRDQNGRDWNGITERKADVVFGADDDFWEQLSKYPHVKTLVIPWERTLSSDWNSLTDLANVLVQKYYEWSATESLCMLMEKQGHRPKYDMNFDITCKRHMNRSIQAIPLPLIFLNLKPAMKPYYWPKDGQFPRSDYEHPPAYVSYTHILEDAITSDSGDVYSKKLQLVPYSCNPSRRPDIPNVSAYPLYDEVFVITQYWGTATFHRMAEIVPRLALSLDFLRRNPQIKIACPEGPGGRLGEFMKIFGLSEDRMVTGPTRAKIAYVPRASQCGTANVQELQVASMHYRRYVERHLGALTRNKLVLIRRTGHRRFKEQLAIEAVLQSGIFCSHLFL